jgi:membrane-associated protease RseP (regulator of RpoE activity)
MITTAVNAILMALLTLVPTAPEPRPADDDPREREIDRKVVVAVGDEDFAFVGDGDDPIVVRVGKRGFIGVRLVGITPELKAHWGAPRDAGVLVAGVEPESPAARAGVQVGDVITGIDGESVDSSGDLSRAVRRKSGGETLALEVVRDRAKRQLTVTVEERRAREREIDLGDLGRDIRRHAWVLRDHDSRRPLIENLEDLPSLRDRLEDLEKRVKELEKKAPGR